MRRNEGEPKKNLVKRAWEAITRRGRNTPVEPPPAPPTPLSPEPAPLSPEFQQFVEPEAREYLIRKQQRWAQARAMQEQAQLAERQRVERETKEREQLAEKKIREAEEGKEVCQLLEQTEQIRRIVTWADNIKSQYWVNNQNTPINLEEVSTPDEKEQDDGTWIRRSHVGRKVSYDYTDVGEYNWTETSYGMGAGEMTGGVDAIFYWTGGSEKSRREMLTFGIGYFGDRETIIQEAQMYVSDEQLREGVAAYFIQRNIDITASGYGRIDEKSPTPSHISETFVIPVAHPEAEDIFKSRLFAIAEKHDPDIVVEKANERIRAPREQR